MTAAVMGMHQLPQANFRAGAFAAGTALVLTLTAAWLLMDSGDAHEISRLQIEGELNRVSAQAVAAAVRSGLGEGFLALNLDAVKADAESLPWVARARVERLWPAGVRVRVWEREPFARWGETGLLDTEARVFLPKAAEIPLQLPRLAGPKGREREVMEAYQRLSARLVDTPFVLAGLTLDARGEWAAQTQAGIGLHLGQSAPDEKLELLRGPVAKALRERLDEVDYVDLRYTNGFAVGWKNRPGAKDTAAGEEKHG